MKNRVKFFVVFMAVCFILPAVQTACGASAKIKLPEPKKKGEMSVEQAISERRSIRSFSEKALTLEQVSQMLWAAGGATVDGVTGPTRAYPSAGGLYPLEIYLVAGNVEGLPIGIYKYNWSDNSLQMVAKGDFRIKLSMAAMRQMMVRNAPATIVVTASTAKVMSGYGKRGTDRYVSMDAGHLGENVHLQAQVLGLGTVMVGAFDDKYVSEILNIKDASESPIYIMPFGVPSSAK